MLLVPTHRGVASQRSYCVKGDGQGDDWEVRELDQNQANTPSFDGSDYEALYRLLPSVNDLLLSASFQSLFGYYSRDAIVLSARSALDCIRQQIADGQHTSASLAESVALIANAVKIKLDQNSQFSLRPVINATGVILHTNLGRAPLGQSVLDHIIEVATGYSNLEFDLDSGERGHRDTHADSLILSVVSRGNADEDLEKEYGALVVNNCAAATFLALNSLAEKKEVVISRGELVEIGGSFRIPEILEKSGALLKEVGTTNRTRLSDYEQAISSDTALILRVHQSNFSMEGFVEKPSLADLVALGRLAGIPVFEDQGTGLVASLRHHGINEATLPESFAQGCHLIASSGDKLLGGPQCGILIGKKSLTDRIRKNPLFRTFRADKLTYAALEATLMEYASGKAEGIPIVRMLNAMPEEIRGRCEKIASQMSGPDWTVNVVEVRSMIGGGTAPSASLPSYAISLQHAALSAEAILRALRQLQPPLIGRIHKDRVLLDLRTVDIELDAQLAVMLGKQLQELRFDI